jgi:hypothetical protein
MKVFHFCLAHEYEGAPIVGAHQNTIKKIIMILKKNSETFCGIIQE